MKKRYDNCIIGAGAAGLAAAVEICREGGADRLLVLEKNNQVGKKILATGNGRCNLTNTRIAEAPSTLDFFASLGLATSEEEEGRVYPASERAEDVVYVLEEELRRHGVTVTTNVEVTKVELGEEASSEGQIYPEPSNRYYKISWKGGTFLAKNVLLACGGKAAPSFGTVGDSYRFARQLGHSAGPLYPVLTGVKVRPLGGEGGEKDQKPSSLTLCNRVRAKAKVSLFEKGKDCLFESRGQVQFTDYGLSGIVLFDASRHIRLGEDRIFEDYEIRLDLAPDISLSALCKQMEERKERGQDLLRGYIPQALCPLVGEASLSDAPKDMAASLKALPFVVTGLLGWQQAQVTGGGVPLAEVDPVTMASRVAPGLYLAGEVLDYAGPCGGYNLQNAWSTGRRAGKAMAQEGTVHSGNTDDKTFAKEGAVHFGKTDDKFMAKEGAVHSGNTDDKTFAKESAANGGATESKS